MPTATYIMTMSVGVPPSLMRGVIERALWLRPDAAAGGTLAAIDLILACYPPQPTATALSTYHQDAYDKLCNVLKHALAHACQLTHRIAAANHWAPDAVRDAVARRWAGPHVVALAECPYVGFDQVVNRGTGAYAFATTPDAQPLAEWTRARIPTVVGLADVYGALWERIARVGHLRAVVAREQ